MTSIQIPPEAVQAVVAQAIMESITPEVREKILADAIGSLLTTPPQKPLAYGAMPLTTPLKSAFDAAVHTAVHVQARKMVEESTEAQAAIKAAIGGAIFELCADNYDGLPEKIGEAIGIWLQERRR